MAEILITGVGMPKSCEYKDDEGNNRICFMFNSCTFRDCPLVEVPPHGRLCDIDRMISESRKVQLPANIQSADELADFLEIYADLDKSPYGNTVVIPASKEVI